MYYTKCGSGIRTVRHLTQPVTMKTPLLLSLCLLTPALAFSQGYEERDGIVSIEAEDFASQTLADVRRWFKFDASTPAHSYADADKTHVEGASGGAYLEILPDTRTNHDETLVQEENFSDEPGRMAILSYPVHFHTPGRYYVWGRAFSTGTEDNGLHVGLNGAWPESGRRLQWCQGKHQWTWSSAQRRPEKHCGEPLTLWLDIDEPGLHTVLVSMREDGTELDKLVLALDPDYRPEGLGPVRTFYEPAALPEKESFFAISHYQLLLRATEDFEIEGQSKVPYYRHEAQQALAINAGNKAFRDGFARATYTFSRNRPAEFDLTLVTLVEFDGESDYRVWVNDRLIGEFTNPESETDYHEVYFKMEGVELKRGDVIAVESNAVTNGKIPERDETAWARGRWRGLVLQ